MKKPEIRIHKSQWTVIIEALVPMLAENGDGMSQSALGYIYKNGEGVKQDYSEAFKWFSLAADQGGEVAQEYLGDMYFNGEGVEQDYSEAYKWCSLAADKGNSNALFALGMLYKNGLGVSKNKISAYLYFNLSNYFESTSATKELHKLSTKISPKKILIAQKMAMNWLAEYKKI